MWALIRINIEEIKSHHKDRLSDWIGGRAREEKVLESKKKKAVRVNIGN
jgi:hypothetical protein